MSDSESTAGHSESTEVQNTESSQRQRRRRRRGQIPSMVELRRSNREQRPQSISKNDYTWTVTEKQNLLKALKKYGHLDMEHLCEAVPEKSRIAIEAIILKWWRRSRTITQSAMENRAIIDRRFKEYRGVHKKGKNKKKEPNFAPIEQWLHQLRKAAPLGAYADTKMIAKAMLYISLFEQHPDPNECGGVDFSAVYDYLYRVLMGYPPKDLNPATAQYIIGNMENLAEQIKQRDCHRDVFHLNSVRKIFVKPASVKQYTNHKKEEEQGPSNAEEIWMKTLLEIPGFNPLSIPLELLKQ